MPTSAGSVRRRVSARRSTLPRRAEVSATWVEVSAISWRTTRPLCTAAVAGLSAGVGGQAEPEADQRRPGDRVEEAVDRASFEEVAGAGDGDRVGAEPRQRHRAEQQAEAQQGRQ